jgi:hypothetical protein
MKLLAAAMDYWSNGALKALFLEHEVKLYELRITLMCQFTVPEKFYFIS